MRPLRAALTTLLCAAGLVLFAPADPAAACSCAVGGRADSLRGASTVFFGALVERGRDKRWVEYTFEVDEVYKGSTTRVTRVWTGVSGSTCGLPGLSEGQEYLVFAFRPPKDERLFVGLCGGTTSARGAVAQVEALTGPGSPPDPGGVRSDDDEPGQPFIPYWAMGTIGLGAAALLLLLLRRSRG